MRTRGLKIEKREKTVDSAAIKELWYLDILKKKHNILKCEDKCGGLEIALTWK